MGFVFMMSFKFYGGSFFGSGVFVFYACLVKMNEELEVEFVSVVVDIVEVCVFYFMFYDIGFFMLCFYDVMSFGFCNTGLFFRWVVGLYEMELFNDVIINVGGMVVVEEKFCLWVFVMCEEV